MLTNNPDLERLEKKVDTLIRLMQRIVPADVDRENEFEERLQKSKNRGNNGKSHKKGERPCRSLDCQTGSIK